MGRIRCEGGKTFEVLLENNEDRAALRAALKATPDTDAGKKTGHEDVLLFEADNPSNVVALWAAGFEWQGGACKVAMDLIVPMVWQQISLHAGVGRRMRRMEKEAFTAFPDLKKPESQ